MRTFAAKPAQLDRVDDSHIIPDTNITSLDRAVTDNMPNNPQHELRWLVQQIQTAADAYLLGSGMALDMLEHQSHLLGAYVRQCRDTQHIPAHVASEVWAGTYNATDSDSEEEQGMTPPISESGLSNDILDEHDERTISKSAMTTDDILAVVETLVPKFTRTVMTALTGALTTSLADAVKSSITPSIESAIGDLRFDIKRIDCGLRTDIGGPLSQIHTQIDRAVDATHAVIALQNELEELGIEVRETLSLANRVARKEPDKEPKEGLEEDPEDGPEEDAEEDPEEESEKEPVEKPEEEPEEAPEEETAKNERITRGIMKLTKTNLQSTSKKTSRMLKAKLLLKIQDMLQDTRPDMERYSNTWPVDIWTEQIIECLSSHGTIPMLEGLGALIKAIIEHVAEAPGTAGTLAMLCDNFSKTSGYIYKRMDAEDEDGQLVFCSVLFRKTLTDKLQQLCISENTGEGFLTFISHLYKLGMISMRIIDPCICRLIYWKGPPSVKSASKLYMVLRIVGSTMETQPQDQPLLDMYYVQIQKVTSWLQPCHKEQRRILGELAELRKAGWVE